MHLVVPFRPMPDLLEEDAPLTAEEILRFGPVVEAQVWTCVWLAEQRAPIAVAAGRPRLGRVFNDDGIARAVIIRPCMSRGKRVRGFQPVYTPNMLEANSGVWAGWPMYLDHLAADNGKRSVREMAGQVLTPYWDPLLEMDDDEEFGYQRGGTVAEVWGNIGVRNLVGNNPNALHTSVSAWPTGGKPGPVPWNPSKKGMMIEGIRRQPQGSVDFVPRGGAGGRLRLAEGVEPDERPWPEPEWTEESLAIVVSSADRAYDPATMPRALRITSTTTPEELREMLAEHAPQLVPAIGEQIEGAGERSTAAPAATSAATAAPASSLTESDVSRLVEAELRKNSGPEPLTEEDVLALAEQLVEQREEQRGLSDLAVRMIEQAEGLPDSWKGDLRTLYEMSTDGPPARLVIAEDDLVGDDGADLTSRRVVEARVRADLKRSRARLAEAQGKPVIRDEGDADDTNTGDERKPRGKMKEGEKTPHWRQYLADMGVVESADDALAAVHGVKKTEG